MSSTEKRNTRALLYKGKKVADFEVTGNMNADAERCLQILRDLGLHQETSELEAMHRQAHSFALCAFHLHDLLQRNRNLHAAIPFVTNSTFALEIYLKALLKRFKESPRKTHKLRDLLDSLPADARSVVQMQIPFTIGSEDLKDNYDLAEILENLNNSFNEWRYLHEGKTTSLQVDIPQTLYALRTLHAASFSAILSPWSENGCPIR